MKRKTEHPILFSTPMVQAILALIKLMTRRTRGLEKINDNPDAWYLQTLFLHATGRFTFAPKDISKAITDSDIIEVKCPFGHVGDTLWVREEHKVYYDTKTREWVCEYKDGTIIRKYYKKLSLITNQNLTRRKTLGEWQRGRFMPKDLCRIWLEITDIRVERLQDILEDDAKCEGIEFIESEDPFTLGYKLYGNHNHCDILGRKAVTGTASESFQSLWESINGLESWNANPWVWVIEFKKVEPCQ